MIRVYLGNIVEEVRQMFLLPYSDRMEQHKEHWVAPTHATQERTTDHFLACALHSVQC